VTSRDPRETWLSYVANHIVRSVQIEHFPGHNVHLIECDRPGIVTGVLVDGGGVTYRVAYWNDGTRREDWCLAAEIRGESS
jgi:hypothetical protein